MSPPSAPTELELEWGTYELDRQFIYPHGTSNVASQADPMPIDGQTWLVLYNTPAPLLVQCLGKREIRMVSPPYFVNEQGAVSRQVYDGVLLQGRSGAVGGFRFPAMVKTIPEAGSEMPF